MDFSQGGSDDTVFDKRKSSPPFIHALFRGAYWLRYLILLHKREYREDYTTVACQALEVTVMDLFTKVFYCLYVKMYQRSYKKIVAWNTLYG